MSTTSQTTSVDWSTGVRGSEVTVTSVTTTTTKATLPQPITGMYTAHSIIIGINHDAGPQTYTHSNISKGEGKGKV